MIDILFFILLFQDTLKNQISLAKKIARLGICIIKLSQWMCIFLQMKFEQSNSTSLKLLVNSLNHLCNDCQKEKSVKLPKHIMELQEKKIISSLNEDMFLSASVGQMYLARSFEGDETYIVKIKHDNLLEEIEKWKRFLRQLSVYIDIDKILDLSEFFDYLYLQLDFVNEVDNMKLFQKRYRKNKNILIPECYYVTEEIIVMQYIESYHFYNTFRTMDDENKRYYELLGKSFFMDHIFVHDLLHADLHAGNFGIVPSQKAIVIYDYGWILKKEKTRDFKRFFLLCHIATEDQIDPEKEKLLFSYVQNILQEKKLNIHAGLKMILQIFSEQIRLDSFMFCILSLCLFMNSFLDGELEPNMNQQILNQIQFIEKERNFLALGALLRYRPEDIQEEDDKQSILERWYDRIYGEQPNKVEILCKSNCLNERECTTN